MISMILPLAAGNALRLFMDPPVGSVRWRVLRKGVDSFTDEADPDAYVAYEGAENVVVDSSYLPNEQVAFYRPFYIDASGQWTAGPTAQGTPAATYEELTTDVLTVVRERLEAGLQVEVQRGTLHSDTGVIRVYTAPPSMEQDIRFPVVTIHVESEQAADRALGEYIGGDDFDAVGFDWQETEGWLAEVKLQIIGWSLNGDERQELRRAIRRLVIANLPVFSGAGIEQVDLEQSDVDALNEEYGAPIYQAVCQFSCLAPVRVGNREPAIRDVITIAREIYG